MYKISSFAVINIFDDCGGQMLFENNVQISGDERGKSSPLIIKFADNGAPPP